MSCSRIRRKRPPPSAVRMAISRRSCRGAGSQQVGDIEARDQQHAAGGGQQHIQRGLHVAHQVIDQRPHSRAAADERKVEMGVMDAAHDGRDFLCGLLTSDAGLQPSNDYEPVVADLAHLRGRSLVVHGKEDLHLLLGKSKPTRHHANHGVGFGIKIDFAADDGRVTTKAALPKRPTEDDGTVGGRLVVLRHERRVR